MLRLIRVRHLLAVGAVLAAMSAMYGAMHTTQGLKGGLEDAPLSPADYRAPIVAVEARLFAAGPLPMEERVGLAAAFDAMRRELDARASTNMAKYGARELGTLSGMSRGLGELGGPDLERVRQNWMRIRANTFADASWFRFSEADPVAPAEDPAVALTDADRATIAGLRTALDRIEDATRRGERDAEGLGEPSSAAGADERRALEASWSEWGAEWRRELDGIRDWMPAAPGPEAPATVRSAHADALRALDALRAVPGAGGRVPRRQDWTRRFGDARKQVRDARGWIERAERGLGV